MKKYQYIFVLFAVMLFVLLGCEEPLSPPDFKDDINSLTRDKTELNLRTVFYQYNDRIALEWDTIPNAVIYEVYAFSYKTGQISKRTRPIGYTTKLRTTYFVRKNQSVMYFMVQAVDKDGKVIIISNKIEGRVIESPLFIDGSKQYFYKIILKWTHVLGGKEYIVRRREKTGGEFTTIAIIHPNKEQIKQECIEYEDKNNIKSSTTYVYEIKVQAFDDLKKPLGSNILKKELQTTKQYAPNSPEEFSVSKYKYARKIVLHWKDPENLDGFLKNLEGSFKREDIVPLSYRIYRRLSSILENENTFIPIYYGILDSKNGVYTYEDIKIAVGNVYEYKIVALSKINKEEGMETDVLEGATIPVPEIKSIVKVYVDGDKTKQKIRLSWNAYDDFKERTSLEIWRAFKGGGEFVRIKKGLKGSFYDIDVSELLDTVYEYKLRYVSFVDNAVYGLYSNIFEYKYRHDQKPVGINTGSDLKESDDEKNNADERILESLHFTIEGGWRNKVRLLWKPLEGYSDDAYLVERIELLEKEDGVTQKVIKYPNLSLHKVERRGEEYLEAFVTGLQSDEREWGFLGMSHGAYKEGLKKRIDFVQNFRVGITLKDGRTIKSNIYSIELFSFGGDVIASKGYKKDKIIVKWNSVPGAVMYSVTSRWKIADNPSRYYEQVVKHNPQGSKIQTMTIVKPDAVPDIFTGAPVVITVEARGKDFLEDDTKSYSKNAKGSVFGVYGMHFSVSSGLIDKIQLNWDAVKYAESYLIVRRIKKEKNTTFEIARIAASEGKNGKFSYTDSVNHLKYLNDTAPPLDNRIYTEYEYAVIPEKKGVLNPYSSVYRIGSIFAPPRNVKATRGVPIDGVIISWDEVQGADAYGVYYWEIYSRKYALRVLASASSFKRNSEGRITYKDTSIVRSGVNVRFYKVISFKETRRSTYPRNPVKGSILSTVRNVRASDRAASLNYFQGNNRWNSSDIYVVNSEAELVKMSDYRKDPYSLNRNYGFATKITWDLVEGADRYYVYRLDFNEKENFWNKIAEITIKSSAAVSKNAVFYDARALMLREYRTVYWVVAVAKDENGGLHEDSSFSEDKGEVVHRNVIFSKTYDPLKVEKEILSMQEYPNIDAGSRQITTREYMNWALCNIGAVVRKIGARYWTGDFAYVRESSFGINVWGRDVVYELTQVNIARLHTDTHIPDYRKEIVINTPSSTFKAGIFTLRGALMGSGTQGVPSLPDVIVGNRAGRYYSGDGKKVSIESPYGRAYISFSNVYYDFREGTIYFKWEMRSGNSVFSINKSSSNAEGSGNAFFPRIFPAFNYSYSDFFDKVYSQYRPLGVSKRSRNDRVIKKEYK